MTALAADDPRHGTVAGYVAHTKTGGPKCGACKAAYSRWEKRQRARLYLVGPAHIDALGTQRRIRSLVALGHTLRDQDAAMGRRPGFSHYVLTTPSVSRSTAAKYHALFERLCMVRPEGWRADRARSHAAKRGWPPPLAFNNIDDPNENPTGWEYVPANRADHLTDLDHRQAGITEVCAELGIRRDSVERWCERHGLRAMYVRFIERETRIVEHRNQWSA